MKIVVLAGGTSTERTISIVSGTGICKALRQKGHQAVLADIFCGVENVEWEDPFPQEYDVDAASAYMSGFNDKIEEMKKERRSFFGPNILQLCEQADVVFLGLHGANGEDGKVQAAFPLYRNSILKQCHGYGQGNHQADVPDEQCADSTWNFHAEIRDDYRH